MGAETETTAGVSNHERLFETAAAQTQNHFPQRAAQARLLHDGRAVLALGVHGGDPAERQCPHRAVSNAVSRNFRSASFGRCADWSRQRQRGNHYQSKGGVKSMDSTATSTAQGAKLNGLFVRGIVMSSVAKALQRKDGTGVFVIVRNEIALQPGLALWEAFHDPKDGKVKLDGENVIQFPKLPDFQQVTLKVLRWEEKDKRFVIREAELVA